MRRKILWLTVAVLTFVVGLAIAWLVNIYQQPKEQSEVSPVNLDYMREGYCRESETTHDFEKFWTEFQSAVRTNDKVKLFSMIATCKFKWPSEELGLKRTEKLKTSHDYFFKFFKFEKQDELVRNYDRIFAKKIKGEILECVSPKGRDKSYLIEWMDQYGSFTLDFTDSGSGFKFVGLEEGPP